MKNNIKLTITLFILSIITLISTVFAWVSLSKKSNLGGMGGNISDFTDLVTFEVKRKDDSDFIEIKTIEDMQDIFWTTKPGETYTFKIKIVNDSARKFEVFSSVNGIKTLYSDDNLDFDLRNVFYLDKGEVQIKKNQDNLIINTLDVISNEPVTIYNQLLNNYRLNNLIDERNNLALFLPVELLPSDHLEVTFTLVYDITTEDTRYQDNQLSLEGIFIYGQ